MDEHFNAAAEPQEKAQWTSCGQYCVDRARPEDRAAARRVRFFWSAVAGLTLILLGCAALIVAANALFEAGEDLQDLDVAVFHEERDGKIDEDQRASGRALVALAVVIFLLKAAHVSFFDPTLFP
jgi:hypothetical protein